MGTVITIAQFLLSLSILIILHECGHFFPAKWFKTRVEKFYLFFDPYFSLFSFKKGETEYGIGWLPLGGYVKISGMIDESFDKEQMEGPAQPWEFRSKPAWQRLIIMIGGVTVNLILGVLLFAMIFNVWGRNYLPNSEVKYGIYVDSLGTELGFLDGDKILKIGDKEVERFSKGQFITDIVFNDGSKVTVERDGREMEIQLNETTVSELANYSNSKKTIFGLRKPFKAFGFSKDSHSEAAGLKVDDRIIGVDGKIIPWFHEFGPALDKTDKEIVNVIAIRNDRDTVYADVKLTEDKKLGIYPYQDGDLFNYENEKFGFIEAIPIGARHGMNFISMQAKAFGKMFTGELNPNKSMGSLITIAKEYGPRWDWLNFWNMTATLSILLAFINILPIPALDGGHVMFLLWEVITGKKPSDKVLEYSTMAGFIFLVLLMVYALGIDFVRHVFN